MFKKKVNSTKITKTVDPIAGIAHQTLKLLRKTCKIIKSFLIRKVLRKIKENGESNNSELDSKLNLLKNLDHNTIGDYFLDFFFQFNTESPSIVENFDNQILNEFKSHKLMKEAVSLSKEKYDLTRID